MNDPNLRPSALARGLCVAVGLAAAARGVGSLSTWILAGTAPGASEWSARWPALSLGLLAGISLVAALRRPGLLALATGLVVWAAMVNVLVELPRFASSHWFADGPALVPVYLALGAGLAMFVVGGGAGVASFERSAAALTILATGNLKMWSREADAIFALFAGGVLALWASAPRARSLRSTSWLGALACAFLLWVLLAGWFADHRAAGLVVWSRCLVGALFAWALAGGLEHAGVERVLGAMALGVLGSLALCATGLVEASDYVPWSRIAMTRLRLFDLHANGSGPLFGIGCALMLSLSLGGYGRSLTRALLLVGALLCAAALWRTESRASLMGLGLALALLPLALSARLPRRPWRWLGAGLGLCAAGLAAFASPLGAPLRARLHEYTLSQHALGQRYHFWEMAVAAAREHPWFGLGPNQYYAHAQYALSSFYDGTPQGLHAHNIVLGVLEGAGWLGAALFVALVLGVLELLRRALLAGADRRARAAPAALLGVTVALLGANLLDLGQSQTTFVPYALWIVAGLGAAWTGGGERMPASGPRALAGALLFLPLVAAPLYTSQQGERARALHLLAETPAQQEAALACYERARPSWYPVDEQVLFDKSTLLVSLGRQRKALDAARAAMLCMPSFAGARSVYAQLALESQRPEEAYAALQEVAQLDPYGASSGRAAMLLAWVHLLRGEREQAEAELQRAFVLQAGGWQALPHLASQEGGGERAGARSISFLVGDGSGPSLPLDEVFDALYAEALELAPEDDAQARRRIGMLVGQLRALDRGEEALEMLRAHAALVPERIESTMLLEVGLLCELGRHAQARALVGEVEQQFGRPLMFVRAELGIGYARSGDPELLAQLPEIVPPAELLAQRDIFFHAGTRATSIDVLAQAALMSGEIEAARALQSEALYDRRAPQERVKLATDHLVALAGADAPDAALAAALDACLREAALLRKKARNEGGMRQRVNALLTAWDGPLDELPGSLGLSDHGVANQTFVRVLERRLGRDG